MVAAWACSDFLQLMQGHFKLGAIHSQASLTSSAIRLQLPGGGGGHSETDCSSQYSPVTVAPSYFLVLPAAHQPGP
jgi:hypothetical protein